MERSILGTSLSNKQRNGEKRKITSEECIAKLKWHWAGHIPRFKETGGQNFIKLRHTAFTNWISKAQD